MGISTTPTIVVTLVKEVYAHFIKAKKAIMVTTWPNLNKQMMTLRGTNILKFPTNITPSETKDWLTFSTEMKALEVSLVRLMKEIEEEVK